MTCAKVTLTATIVALDGSRHVGTNYVNNPQATCPRAGMPTGVGYELCKSICDQPAHAEVNACLAAGERARGGTLYLEGHYYACEDCKRVCDEHGIAEIIIGAPPAGEGGMSKHRTLGRVCSTCPTGISDKSTTGKCKPCFMREANADPEMRRRRAQTLSRRCSRGGDLHKQRLEGLAKARAARDMEALRERGHTLVANFPANEEKRRANHAAAMRKRRHRWLPDEWRELYKTLTRSRGYTAPEAKAIILEHIELQKQRRRRKREAKRLIEAQHSLLEARLCVSRKVERDTFKAAVNAVSASQRLRDAILGAAR